MREISIDEIRDLIRSVVGNSDLVDHMEEHSALLGALPEMDSIAVVNLMLGLEQQFGFHVDDDEVEVEIFETVGSLRAFAQRKLTSKQQNN